MCVDDCVYTSVCVSRLMQVYVLMRVGVWIHVRVFSCVVVFLCVNVWLCVLVSFYVNLLIIMCVCVRDVLPCVCSTAATQRIHPPTPVRRPQTDEPHAVGDGAQGAGLRGRAACPVRRTTPTHPLATPPHGRTRVYTHLPHPRMVELVSTPTHVHSGQMHRR